jgi:Bacterial archaeo-eukaryotic release factor family 10
VDVNQQTLVSVMRIRDPYGVLSVYVDADPTERTREKPAWQVVIKNELEALRERVKSDGPHETWRALFARLEALEPDLERLLDPKESGRGRALYAAVSDGGVERLAVQLPLPNRVVFERTAYVRPLLAVLDEARPAGIVMVSRSGVRLCEWKLGVADELARWKFEPETQEWRESKAKPSRSPSPGQQIALERDRFERRLDEARRRFFVPVAQALDGIATGRSWERLLLAGDPRLTEAFVAALPKDGRREVVASERLLEDLDRHALGQAVVDELRAAKRRREVRLVERALDAALSGGAGALGLDDVLAALFEGRVHTLVLDGDREWAGLMEPDGRLWPEGTQPGDVPSGKLTAEPFLAERMIEQALARGATVTPVEREAAAPLADYDGTAAILRWKG